MDSISYLVFLTLVGKCLTDDCRGNAIAQCGVFDFGGPVKDAKQLDNKCRVFTQWQECMDSSAFRCPEAGGISNSVLRDMLQGTKDIMTELCTTTQLRAEFLQLQHSECFQKTNASEWYYTGCGDIFAVSGNLTFQLLNGTAAVDPLQIPDMCRGMDRLMQCYVAVPIRYCGDSAVNASAFQRTYTEIAVGPVVRRICERSPLQVN